MVGTMARTLVLIVVVLLGAAAQAPAASPRSNDSRNSAQPLGALPAAVTGTTAGASVEAGEPPSGCAQTAGSVWYSFSFGASPPGEVGVKVQANGDLDAAVDVFQRQRSQNIPVSCARTDQNGFAGTTFQPSSGATYLIRIAQRANSTSGTFSLKVFVVPPAPSPPGAALPARGGHGVLDSTFDTQDAYSLRLQAGTTYKVNLVKSNNGCMSLGIFPPGTSSFGGSAAAGVSCGGYRLFTPTLGGRWSFLVTAASGIDTSQPYWLHVALATSLEMAPGIPLPNFARYTATLHGNLDTDVRLFRFDVTTFSDLTLFLQTASNESFDLKLLNDQGRYLECDCGSRGEETIRREMRPGRYFVVVQAQNFESGPFTLSRESRTITHVRVSFDGFGYEQISPGASTRITATVSPAVDGPVTFELEYFDPVERWQFRGDYHAEAVNGVAVLPFTPPAAGRWRATVGYSGTRGAAPATSGWANLLVAAPLSLNNKVNRTERDQSHAPNATHTTAGAAPAARSRARCQSTRPRRSGLARRAHASAPRGHQRHKRGDAARNSSRRRRCLHAMALETRPRVRPRRWCLRRAQLAPRPSDRGPNQSRWPLFAVPPRVGSCSGLRTKEAGQLSHRENLGVRRKRS